MDDGETKNVTPTFYKHMIDESGHLDHTRAAFMLNKTIKSANIIRAADPVYPSRCLVPVYPRSLFAVCNCYQI